MGGSSGGGGGSSTTTNLPMPQLAGAFGQYGNQLNSFMQNPGTAFNAYQGQTQAATSPFMQQAVSALANPGAINQAQQYFGDVAGGQYLGLNPAMQNAVINPAVDATNASFNQLGRFGSPANAEGTQRAAMQAMMPFYNAERGRQGQAAGMLPGLQSLQAQNLQQAGGIEQGIGQRDIREAQAQFQQQNYSPEFGALQAYGGLLQPGAQFGTSTTDAQRPGGSQLASGLGGALTGAAAGSAAGASLSASAIPALAAMGPYGWAIGAGLGLLGGFPNA